MNRIFPEFDHSFAHSFKLLPIAVGVVVLSSAFGSHSVACPIQGGGRPTVKPRKPFVKPPRPNTKINPLRKKFNRTAKNKPRATTCKNPLKSKLKAKLKQARTATSKLKPKTKQLLSKLRTRSKTQKKNNARRNTRGFARHSNGRSGMHRAFAKYEKHKKEFPEYKGVKAYYKGAMSFANNPPAGTITVYRPNRNEKGKVDTLLIHPKTNTLLIKHPDGKIGTMFRPKRNSLRNIVRKAGERWKSEN